MSGFVCKAKDLESNSESPSILDVCPKVSTIIRLWWTYRLLPAIKPIAETYTSRSKCVGT